MSTVPKSLTQGDIKSLISSEIRNQLVEAGQGHVYNKDSYPPVKTIPESDRLRILITGGSGFVGSHLVDRLMLAGHQITVVDNMFTGRKKNIVQWIGHLINCEFVIVKMNKLKRVGNPSQNE